MMTNYRSDPKTQNNDLATQRTQQKDDTFGWEIALMVDGMDSRTSTSIVSGLQLLLTIYLRSDSVSDQEAINFIKIHGFQKMIYLVSVGEHIKMFFIHKHK